MFVLTENLWKQLILYTVLDLAWHLVWSIFSSVLIFKIYFQSFFISWCSLKIYLFLSFSNFVWFKHHFNPRLVLWMNRSICSFQREETLIRYVFFYRVVSFQLMGNFSLKACITWQSTICFCMFLCVLHKLKFVKRKKKLRKCTVDN